MNNSVSKSLRIAVKLIPDDEVSAAAADKEKSSCPHLHSSVTLSRTETGATGQTEGYTPSHKVAAVAQEEYKQEYQVKGREYQGENQRIEVGE
jgi:hypothetical protein